MELLGKAASAGTGGDCRGRSALVHSVHLVYSDAGGDLDVRTQTVLSLDPLMCTSECLNTSTCLCGTSN